MTVPGSIISGDDVYASYPSPEGCPPPTVDPSFLLLEEGKSFDAYYWPPEFGYQFTVVCDLKEVEPREGHRCFRIWRIRPACARAPHIRNGIGYMAQEVVHWVRLLWSRTR